MTIRHLKRAAARVATTPALQDRRVRGGVARHQASSRWRLGAVAGVATLAMAAMGTISSPAQGIGECANNTPANPPPGYNVEDLTAGGNPFGTSGDDFIWGTSVRDVITGDGGNDIICGNGGNDFLDGEGGEDEIYGGDGPDDIYGGLGSDPMLSGGPDDDLIVGDQFVGPTGSDGDDWLQGGEDEDELFGYGGEDTLRGGPDVDTGDGGDDSDTCTSILNPVSCP